MPQSTWKVEPAYPASNTVGQAPPGLYQPPGTKKTYITDPGMAPQPLQQKVGDAALTGFGGGVQGALGPFHKGSM